MDISAVITTYNRCDLVIEAIASVLAQSDPVRELIVVDDGSSDGTEQAVLAAFEGARVPCRYIRKPNGGMASSLNRGIAESSGEWIAILDDDDLWDVDHIRRAREIHATHPGAGCICGLRLEGGKLQVPPPKLMESYVPSQADDIVRIHPRAPLTAPFFTPVVGTSVLRRDLLLALPFSTAAGGRLDIQFFWKLSELTDIALDARSHGEARQCRISLISTDDDAPEELKQKVVLKRNQDEIAMLEDLLDGRPAGSLPVFATLLADALIGRSYILRGYARFAEARQSLSACWGRCRPHVIVKEYLLSVLGIGHG